VADLENALARRKRELRAALIAGQRQKLEFELTEHKSQIGEEIDLWENHVKNLKERVDKLPNEMVNSSRGSGQVESLKNELKSQEQTLQDLSHRLKVYRPRRSRRRASASSRRRPGKIRTQAPRPDAGRGLPGHLFPGGAGRLVRRVPLAQDPQRPRGDGRPEPEGAGQVPNWPQAGGEGLFIGPDEGPPGADKPSLIEAIDGIRTLLLRGAGEQGSPVVMVTSAVEGEGKTTLASNLALSMARSAARRCWSIATCAGPAPTSVRADVAAGLQRAGAGRGGPRLGDAANHERTEPVAAAGRAVGPGRGAGAGPQRRAGLVRPAARGV